MDEFTKARVRLYLRSERAMGLGAVPFVGESTVSADAPPSASINAHADHNISDVAQRRSVRNPVEIAAQPAAEISMKDPMKSEAPLLVSVDAPFTSPVLMTEEKRKSLSLMEANEVRGCQKCRLCETRTQTVFGEGDVDAKIFFIGEGPGETEDQTGRPFVGRAGELLNKMIAGMGLAREQVFIANIVKCRPPNNRVPAPDEVATCTPYLERQLETIRPRAIVTLGLPSTQYMLKTKLSMGKLRGHWHNWRGIQLMPTYHPAYVLRNPTLETRAAVWSDLKQVLAELGLPIPKKNI
jgi:uracil-DNA glycosylase family 4